MAKIVDVSMRIFSKNREFVQQWIRKDPGRATMIAASTIMFFVYLLIPFTTQTYISPDETINAFSAHRMSQIHSLWYVEPLNLDAFDRIHPRATESNGGLVHPSGWWGLSFIYGVIGALTHPMFMNVITAILAITAVWLFMEIVTYLFDITTATVGFFIHLFHPAWWYYATHPWHHNVPFISLLIITLWVALKRPFTRSTYNLTTLVLLSFLSMLMRPISIVWMIIPAALIAYAQPKTRSSIYAMAGGAVCAILAFVLIHTQLWTMTQELAKETNIASTPRTYISFLFPNGFHIKIIARSILMYGFGIFWWMFIPFCMGFYMLVKTHYPRINIYTAADKKFGIRKQLQSPFAFGHRAKQEYSPDEMRMWYIIGWVAISAVVLLWYGSWMIIDNPDPRRITLANSYVRYWLPVYIGAIPIVVHGLLHIIKKIRFKHTFSLVMAGMILMSIGTVLYGNDGIPAVIHQLRTNAHIREEIHALTPENAVIITDRHDKVFFPDRRVLFPVDHPGTFESVVAIKNAVPLFIYDLAMSEQELQELQRIYNQMGLLIVPAQTFGNERLYKLEHEE